MAITWYTVGNAKLGFEEVGAGETVVVQADPGQAWKVINITYSDAITIHYVDADGLDCEFDSDTEAGSREFGNLQIQDENGGWLEIDNDGSGDSVIVIDAIVWG